MRATDILQSRFDQIESFLSANGATIFAKLLYSIPLLDKTARDNRLTMIFAPSDLRLQAWSTALKRPLAEIIDSSVGRDIMANHLSIENLHQTHPIYVAVNGVGYGRTVADIQALTPTAKTIIDGVFVAVIPHIIIDVDQPKQLEGSSTSGNLEKLTYDSFQSIVMRGGLSGRDLLNFCDSTEDVNERLCQHRDRTGRTIFHYLLKQEFDIEVPPETDARYEYSRRYPKAFPTVGVISIKSQYKRGLPRRFFSEDPSPGITMTIRDGIEFDSLTVDELLEILWRHPIDPVYFLVIVYPPRSGSFDYRVVAWKLVKSRYGKIFSDDGRRFELDPRNISLNSGEEVGPDEIPIKTTVYEYSHAYPEVLPFVYNEEIRKYNKGDLSIILNGLFRFNYTREELRNHLPNIIDLYPGLIDKQSYGRSVAISLSSLGFELATVKSKPSFTEATRDLMEFRFKRAYARETRDSIETIIKLLLIVSGATRIRSRK